MPDSKDQILERKIRGKLAFDAINRAWDILDRANSGARDGISQTEATEVLIWTGIVEDILFPSCTS